MEHIPQSKKVIAKFNSLTYSGYGEGITGDGERVFAWNAYPGEKAVVSLFRHTREPFMGVATDILKASPHRIDPKEPHFIISSPWQTLSYEKEIAYKKNIVKKLWREQAGIELPAFNMTYDNYQFGYRNQMEYNFADTKNGLSLALLQRGRKKAVPVAESALVYPCINITAQNLCTQLSLHNVHAPQLGQLVIKANRAQEMIAALSIHDKHALDTWSCVMPKKMIGFNVFYQSTVKDHALELLYSYGRKHLLELVCGSLVQYGVQDFFQANVPLFEKAIKSMRQFTKNEIIVDYYSGVGAIGIALHKDITSGVLVEASKNATAHAQKNIVRNKIKNITAVASLTEDMLEYITHDKVVIVDPPREGLHERVIKKIAEVLPKRIIYISCKPYTQCRDIAQLLKHYRINHIELFNFFPRTPHIESLIILERATI